MERMGFVARIEEDLERTISQGRLPASRFLPSESLLARQYGVSRTTVREALLRLAARGLVVQHPGRKSRAVEMDVAVTLENLSVALHAEGPAHPERRRLLEGYLELKREMTVELLSACCERATESDLEALRDACFTLREDARWKERPDWVEREFNLLRLAAIVASRPGHFLLVQSLERSFWGMAGRLLPHLDGEPICEWAHAAFSALYDKDAQALRQRLTPLLQACDERLLRALSSAREAAGPPAVPLSPRELFRKPPAEREATRLKPSQEASFSELDFRLDAAKGESSPGAPFEEPRIEAELEPAESSSESGVQQSRIDPEAMRCESWPTEQVQEVHCEPAAVTGESWLVEEVQESHTDFEPATCEPVLMEQIQEVRTESGAAPFVPFVEQVLKSHTEFQAVRGKPVVSADSAQAAFTASEAAAGGLSAESCANPSTCWTGSDEMRPTGAPAPESGSPGFGWPSSDTALGQGVLPARDAEGKPRTG